MPRRRSSFKSAKSLKTRGKSKRTNQNVGIVPVAPLFPSAVVNTSETLRHAQSIDYLPGPRMVLKGTTVSFYDIACSGYSCGVHLNVTLLSLTFIVAMILMKYDVFIDMSHCSKRYVLEWSQTLSRVTRAVGQSVSHRSPIMNASLDHSSAHYSFIINDLAAPRFTQTYGPTAIARQYMHFLSHYDVVAVNWCCEQPNSRVATG
ncbi:hypothetical protein GZH46_00263, partial [Fragariocoptes setiger]